MNFYSRFLFFFISLGVPFLSCKQDSRSAEKTQTPITIDSLNSNEIKRVVSQDRTIWQKPYTIIEMLGDISNKTIADIGAGSGYFSFRFIFKAKKVIAIDIEKQLIDMMNNEKSYYAKEIQDKFEARLATPTDSKLNDQEADIVFISNTYTYIDNRVAYLKSLYPKISSKGKIMIIDFKKKLTPIGPDQKDRLAQIEVEQELLNAGYQIESSDDTSLDYQYIIIARKKE